MVDPLNSVHWVFDAIVLISVAIRQGRHWLNRRASRNWNYGDGIIESGDYIGGGERACLYYSYTVSGEYFSGEHWQGIRSLWGGTKKTEEFLARYPAGTRVTVRYNPHSPDQSVLDVLHLSMR